ncbi:hypothetical protein L3X38_005350 [Prunus dulcis]|uniref:Uncharacterized protein n=1 Tax=Prunus dulcis TaxID=3755 RepID=A0AAD5F419_PRUDU|nr:hypothetical protein L3X38_005350 [Prunus dulcis]
MFLDTLIFKRHCFLKKKQGVLKLPLIMKLGFLAWTFFAAKLVETLPTRHWYLGVDILGMHGTTLWYLCDMWMLPMQIILALAILYKNVGIASIATLIATIIAIVHTVPVEKIQEDYQDKLMIAKEERMRKTSERPET